MTRRLIPATLIPATFALGAVLVLAGCGGADEPTAVDAGSDPASATSSAASSGSGDTPTSSSVVAEPTWPADCENRVASSFDYRREPRGWKTPEEAVAHSEDPAIPAGVYVLAPAEPHAATQVWVVDEATNTILAAVSVFPGSTGFYVDGVTTCG
jgi:hypothetical protein